MHSFNVFYTIEYHIPFFLSAVVFRCKEEEEVEEEKKKKDLFFISSSGKKEWVGSLVGELLGTVSHSLRSPLSPVVGGVEFLGHDIFFVILLNPLSIQDTLLCVLYILIVEVFIHFSTFIFCVLYSSPLGWMRSSSSSAWKVKPVLTPSTATMPKWHSSETLRRSRLSWSALKVREKKNLLCFLLTHFLFPICFRVFYTI